MPRSAPLRVLTGRVLAIQWQTARYLEATRPRRLVEKTGPALFAPNNAQESPELLQLRAEYLAKVLETIDETARMARRLAQILRGVVPHPAHEQSVVMMFVNRCRQAAKRAKPLPSFDEAGAVGVRLWTLADAVGEPEHFDVLADPFPDLSNRPPALSEEQRSQALKAILAGTHSSTRAVAALIGASQSAVARDEILNGIRRAVREKKAIAAAAAREAAERVVLSFARVSWKTMSEAERISRAECVTLRSEDRTERGLARVLAAELKTTEDAVRKWLRKLDRAKRQAIKTKHGIA